MDFIRKMAYLLLTRHFGLIIKIGNPLDPNFDKKFSGNHFNQPVDSLGSVLNSNLFP